jgi:hypothetical protein
VSETLGLGPLVSSRAGDMSQIFHGSRVGIDVQAGLFGLAVGVAVSVTEVLGVPAFAQSALVGLMFASSYLPGGVRSLVKQRRFAAVPLLERVVDAPSGLVVRLRGTVERTGAPAGELFMAPGTWRRVVYARTLLSLASPSGRPTTGAREDIRGVPFRVRLGDGAAVELAPAAVRLLEPPQPLHNVPRAVLRALGAPVRGYLFAGGPALLQATLAPGDRIEVVGRLAAEVDVRGQSAPARGVPLVRTLGPPDEGGVWIRRLAPPPP